jgi:16S rRNA (cytosine967-C5)-methyltransferase
VTELAGFAEGGFWVQDAAATLPARLLAVRPGERVLDLCAAPGGKTAQLVAAGGQVVAVEREPKRAARLRENLARLHMQAEVVEADATTWDAGGALFDAVLLDAPCTATGTIRRHPDVPYLKRHRDIAPMAELQRALLAAAAKRLVPDPVQPAEVPGLEAAVTAAGALRTRPDLWAEHGGMDGFFIARWRGQ